MSADQSVVSSVQVIEAFTTAMKADDAYVLKYKPWEDCGQAALKATIDQITYVEAMEHVYLEYVTFSKQGTPY